MNPTLTLEMVERDGRVVYVDPHGAEWYLISPEAFERLRPRLSTTANDPQPPRAACEHMWITAPVTGTTLVRLTCARCGAIGYGHSGEDDETTT